MTATATMLDAALDYARRGWRIFPVRRPGLDGGCGCGDPQCTIAGKHPHITAWPTKATTKETTIRDWWQKWPDANIGHELAGRIGLDVDPRHGGDESLMDLREEIGPLPETPTVLTGGGGEMFLFVAPGATVKNNAGDLAPGLDIRTGGGMVLLPPSLHRSGRRYEWDVSAHPDDVPIAPIPPRLLDRIKASQSRGGPRTATPSPGTGERIAEGQRSNTLFKTGCAMRRHGATEAAILAALLADNAARCDPPLTDEEVGKIATSAARYDPTVTGPTFAYTATGHATSGNGHGDNTATGTNTAINDEPIHLSDMGNGRRLFLRHGRDLLYCNRWQSWLTWDGQRYTRDESDEIERRAKDTVRAMYAEAAALADEDARTALAKHALKSEAGQRVREMINAARSEEGVAVIPATFDRDPWLLNVANGAIDLHTGQMRAARREDRITKLAPVVYDPDATCPTWLAFLDRVMDGKQELIDFLQRAVGYSLTGDISEHCLFLLFGSGRNGKSTFVETLSALLNDYALTTTTDTLLVQRAGGIPNDLARLVGARLVSASESEAGRNLAEALVKQLTGGDTISARFLHAEFFDFRPAFKLWFRTNHKPTIRGTDDGIWSRIKLIPFTQRIPDAEMDKHLPDRLLTELPGILAWAVAGCLAWQRDGLGTPEAVTAATSEYRAEMDILATFLADRCTIGQDHRCTAKELYGSYTTWAEENGEKVVSQRGFGLRLAERGFVNARATGGSRLWAGLKVRE